MTNAKNWMSEAHHFGVLKLEGFSMNHRSYVVRILAPGVDFVAIEAICPTPFPGDHALSTGERVLVDRQMITPISRLLSDAEHPEKAIDVD